MMINSSIVLTLTIRLLLIMILLPSAWGKIHNINGFRNGVSNYQILPSSLIPFATFVIPVSEILLGILIFTGIGRGLPAYSTSILLLIFIIAISINLRKGRDIACACSGVSEKQRISWGLVARNIILFIMAFWLGISNNTPQLNQISIKHIFSLLLTNIPTLIMVIGLTISIILILQLIEHSITLFTMISPR